MVQHNCPGMTISTLLLLVNSFFFKKRQEHGLLLSFFLKIRVINKQQMYGNAHSMATRPVHRSTDITYSRNWVLLMNLGRSTFNYRFTSSIWSGSSSSKLMSRFMQKQVLRSCQCHTKRRLGWVGSSQVFLSRPRLLLVWQWQRSKDCFVCDMALRGINHLKLYRGPQRSLPILVSDSISYIPRKNLPSTPLRILDGLVF